MRLPPPALQCRPPAAVLERIDLAQSVQSIQDLESFRFDLKMKLKVDGGTSSQDPLGSAIAAALLGGLSDISASGAFVAPDSAQITMSFFGQEVSFIQIGTKAWVKDGSSWRETTANQLDFAPQDMLGGFIPDEVLKVAKATREKVNGVDTVRYSFDKSAIEQLIEDTGQAADLSTITRAGLDIWLNAANVPVKISLDFAGSSPDGGDVALTLEMNLTNINDPSIKITPPTAATR